MSKHTPGPWSYTIKPNGAFEIYPEDSEFSVICVRCEWPDKGAYAEANARLIAAAPDLLLCLEVIVCHAEGLGLDAQLHLDEARAAIAKATSHD